MVEAEEGDDGRAPLTRFVDEHMRPFFEKEGARGSDLCNEHRRATLFASLRQRVDEKYHDLTQDLEALCEQREQLEVQRRMHHWLHGWLLVHVPLSWTMVFLTGVHAVMSLYY